MDKRAIGLAIRAVRFKRKLTQMQLACNMCKLKSGSDVEIARVWIQKLESHKHEPKITTLFWIIEALHIKPWTFFRYLYRLDKQLQTNPESASMFLGSRTYKQFHKNKKEIQ